MLKLDNGNDDLYQYLFDKYYKLVYTTAYRIVMNKEDSEEITQDAFRIGFKNINKINNVNHFRNYILKITYNLSIVKSKKNKARYNMFPTPINDEITCDEDKIEEVFEEIYFSQILQDLPVVDREILLLYSQGYKIREIANILSISVANAKVKIHRSRKLLLDNIQEEAIIHDKSQRQSV